MASGRRASRPVRAGFAPWRGTARRCYGRGGGGRSYRGTWRQPITRALREHGGGCGPSGALGAPPAAATAADTGLIRRVRSGRADKRGAVRCALWFGVQVRLSRGTLPPIAAGLWGHQRPAWRLQRGAARFGRLQHNASRHGAGRRAPERIPEQCKPTKKARTARANSVASGKLSIMDVDPAFRSFAGSHSRTSPRGCQHHSPRDYGPTNRAANRAAQPRHGRSHAPRGSAHRGHSRRCAISAPQLTVSRSCGQRGRIDELLTRHLDRRPCPASLGRNAQRAG